MKYSKYLIEVLIIFGSVMLAFLTESWREHRQDMRDFDLIIDEIESNVLMDIIEINIDIHSLQDQILSLDRLIQDGVTMPSDSLRYYLTNVLITYWPQYNTTGFDQLNNNKNEGSKPRRLMTAIYKYYIYVNWQKEFFSSIFVDQIQDLREYLINNGLSPIGAGEDFAHVYLSESEIDAYRDALTEKEFVNRLAHLRNNRIHELQTFHIIKENGDQLIKNFDPDFKYKSIGIVGSASEKGWDEDLWMAHGRKGIWKIDVSLGDGELKFRADGNWTCNWGGNLFPEGTGQRDGPNIPVAAGRYTITFNDRTESYSFTKLN